MKSLTVSGTLDALSKIAQFVVSAASAAGLDKRSTYKLRLAVDEIATNIIVHGYEEAGLRGEISIHADIIDKTLTITLEDSGAQYDSTQQDMPESMNKPLEEREIGGLGVYLTIQGVDQFLYRRVGDRNHNILVVNRPVTVPI
jgi:anti-sigma regulatory factor (Ser/Thr protein kinase)